MQILVTGYGGFLGSAICRLLIAHGYKVRGLARGRYRELEAMGVQAIQGDIAERDACLTACRDCDAIVHTAAKAGVWGRWDDYHRTNTLATQHLLAAAIQCGIRAFVYTSSPSVTFAGQPQSGVDETAAYPTRWLSHYPHTKALAEQIVQQASRDGTILTCSLRPHLVWGEGDPHLFPRVVQRAKAGRLRRVGSGRNLIDIVHVDNAAQSHLLALRRLLGSDRQLNGQSLFITDGQPIECWEWISKILLTAGIPVPTGSISFDAAYKIGAILESIYGVARIQSEPPMTRFVAAQLALDHYFNIDRAKHLLGYQPNIDRDVKLAECANWLRGLAAK